MIKNEKELDSEEEDVIEKSIAYDIYEYDDNSVHYNCDDKSLLVRTRIGRSAGSWKLSYCQRILFFKAVAGLLVFLKFAFFVSKKLN